MHNGDANGLAPATSFTQAELGADVLQRHFTTDPRYRRVVLVLAGLFLLGVIGFIIKLFEGFDDRVEWGYYAVLVAYLLTTAQSVPLVAIATRMARAHFRRPFSRAAELFTVVGLYNLLLLVPLLFVIPSPEGRKTIWFVSQYRDGWPQAAPYLYDFLAMLILVFVGLGLLFATSLPDLAAARDDGRGRTSLYRRLALGWQGSKRQWRLLQMGIGVLGGFYFLMLVFTHSILSLDLAESQIPGWKDALFPTQHAITGLQSAVALTLVIMYVLRRWGGYGAYLQVEQFWGLSKLLLATSLLWAYFWFAGMITLWYGRQPVEQNVLKYLMFESYLIPFLLAFILCFIAPVSMLIWNPVRKSIPLLTLIGTVVLIGTFFERLRVYVGAFSIEDVTAHELDFVPTAHLPDYADVFILVGGLAGAALVYLLASKIIPLISIWEMKELLLLRRVRTFGRRSIVSLGKPE